MSEPSAVSAVTRSASRPPARRMAMAAAVVVVPAAYLAFVAHFAVNVPSQDDWTVVPLIDAALHGHLSLAAMWSLHDENRMLIPNLVFVSFGVLTHDDTRVFCALSAVLLIGAYAALLLGLRRTAARPLTPLFILVLSILWFSLADWHNAIWAFQVGWYVILLCLVVMVNLLTPAAARRPVAYGAAALLAVIASFSFLQGLALWPVGLVCLVFSLPVDPRRWPVPKKIEVSLWLAAAAATSVIALWGYTFKPLGCLVNGTFRFACGPGSSFPAFYHPVQTIEFVLVEMGEVVPSADTRFLWLNGVLGAVLLGLAVATVVGCVRRREDPAYLLPVALIAFGLIFDVLIAAARVEFLSISAPASSYTMPNLLIVVGIAVYFWYYLGRVSTAGRPVRRTVTVVACLMVAVQLVAASRTGIVNARTFDQSRATAARLVVNLPSIPAGKQGCYELYGEFVYLIFAPGVEHYPAFAEARRDGLTVFKPRPFRSYSAQGLPVIPQCATRP